MIALTYFPHLRTAQGKRYRTTWPKLIERLSVARVVADKHDAPGFSLATYRDDRRALANVERVFAIGLDLDKGVDWETLLVRFDAVDSFVHTTWSSTSDAPRARVFIRLSRPVTGDEYRRVYAACVEVAERGGLTVDRAASDPSRFWFLPTTKPGDEYRYSIGRGAPVDVDGALRVVPASPAPLPEHRPPLANAGDVEKRAAAYLERCEPAISGQAGHTRTFVIAQKLVLGFGLDEETAFNLMLSWNAQCQPPWSERELRRKLHQAAQRGRLSHGSLRDADRRAS